MIIYTGALIWIGLLWLYSNGSLSLTEKQNQTRIQVWLVMLYLVFFIGFRSAGADTHAYLHNYRMTQPGFSRLIRTLFNLRKEETLFEAYTIFMKTLFGGNYTPYLFGIAAISGFAVSKCLSRYSDGFYSSMILFVLFGTWGWLINGIRQFMAVSLTFLALPLLEQRRPLRYFLVVLIASRIHTSALIMIPVYFLVQTEPWEARTLGTVALAILAVTFSSFFLNTLDTVTESMDLDYNSVLSSHYFLEDNGSNPIRTIIFAVPAVLAFLERDTIREKAPNHIKICVNMSIICVCVSAIANVTSGIYIGRLPIYFSMYNLILLPWMFIHTDLKERHGWIPLIMSLYVAVYIFENYLTGGMYYMSEKLGLFIR